MVLIKIKEVPSNIEGLRERTTKAWRINKNRLFNQDKLISTYKGEILQVYKILSYDYDEKESPRIAFKIEEIESNLKGKKIVTKTANPCTIIDEDKLEFK